jgi:hypothetical protein
MTGSRWRATHSQIFCLNSIGYYDGATELYEFGWAKSFHFSRFYKGEGFEQSVRNLNLRDVVALNLPDFLLCV